MAWGGGAEAAPCADDALLTVLEAGPDLHARVRRDLSRHALLRLCRDAAPHEPPVDGVVCSGSWLGDAAGVGSAASLRDVQVLYTKSEPTILVRRGAVLISLGPVKAAVTALRLLLVVPPGADHVLESVRLRLEAAAQHRLDAAQQRHAGECMRLAAA